MSRFIPTQRQNPCILCGDVSGKCREIDDLRLCMEYTDRHESIPGLQFIGRSKDGLWGKWIPINERNRSEEERKRWQQDQAFKRQLREQTEAQRRAEALSPQERDRHYRNLLSQLTLHPDDRADLLRRGLTSEEIADWGVKSVERWQKLELELPYTLAGVALTGDSLNISKSGYLCPVFDMEGYIVSFQIRLRAAENQRYRWLSSRSSKHRPNGPTPHLPNGELPLAVHRPIQVTRQAIVLVEGVGAKPFLTARRREQITVGAAGGQFPSSPQTLKDILDRLTVETNTNLIEFAVDAGMINNERVLERYYATWELLQSWGYEVAILWWGQISKADGDIDELENFACVEAITVEQFKVITQEADSILNRLLRWISRSPRRQQASATSIPIDKLTDSAIVEYELGKRFKTWQTAIQQGYKQILDSSITGSGKSYFAGQLTPELLDVRQLIYASEQHRNPTVDTLTLEQGWVDLEARHGGLVREKTVNSGTRLRRIKPGETYAVPPNCNRIKVLTVLREKNIAGADTANRICGTCPLKGACQHQQGPGYGFLSQRRDALASPQLRAHPQSLPDPTEYEFSSVALIWEETNCSFTTSRSIQVNKADLQDLINRLLFHAALFQQIQPLLTQLLNLFDGNIQTGKFGLAHLELVPLLPAVNDFDLATIAQALAANLQCLNTTAKYGVDLEDLPKTLQKQFLEKDSTLAEQAEHQILKQWFVELVSILQGALPGGSVQFHHHQLTLTLPDDRHRTIAQAARFNIFLDATLNREDLALKLGCQPEEIFVCRQKQPCLNNLKLTQVIDMGVMGMHRGVNQQKRLAALIEHFRQIDPTIKVIDFKKFEQEGAHWRDSRGVNYFSQTTTLVIAGAPCPNVHEMLAQYATLVRQVVSQDDLDFQAWLHRQIEAEVQQEIGRLRANRRPAESLHVVLVTDRPFTFPVEPVKASGITPAAANRGEQVILAARQAIEWLQHQGERITQTAVAAATKNLGLNEGRGYSQQHISRFWQLLTLLLEEITSKRSNPESGSSPDGEIEKLEAAGKVLEVITSSFDLETVLKAIEEVFWDRLRPNEWRLVWQVISPCSQLTVLSALLKTLPAEQLRQLEVVMAAS